MLRDYSFPTCSAKLWLPGYPPSPASGGDAGRAGGAPWGFASLPLMTSLQQANRRAGGQNPTLRLQFLSLLGYSEDPCDTAAH